MAKASFKKIHDTVSTRLDQMVRDLDDSRQFIKKAVIPMYSNAQRKRFQTENESEGEKWLPITKETLAYKLKHFGSYAGGGTKTLIRTGVLYQSLFPAGKFNRTIPAKRSFVTISEVEYAEYVSVTAHVQPSCVVYPDVCRTTICMTPGIRPPVVIMCICIAGVSLVHIHKH